MEETVEIEFGKGRKRPFDSSKKKQENKYDEVPKRKTGVVKKRSDIEDEDLDEIDGKLSSSMLAKIR